MEQWSVQNNVKLWLASAIMTVSLERNVSDEGNITLPLTVILQVKLMHLAKAN